MKCFCCGGVYHPATGHVFREGVAYCGPCTRSFFDWAKRHTARKWGGLNFYEEAARRPEEAKS